MTDTNVKQQIKIRTDIQEPSMYQVIYHNDDTTAADFVTQTLIELFDYDEEKAMDLTQQVHTTGSAVVAVMPYEIAEQKAIEVMALAQAYHFPLQVTVSPN